jgi:hypothetical protein
MSAKTVNIKETVPEIVQNVESPCKKRKGKSANFAEGASLKPNKGYS